MDYLEAEGRPPVTEPIGVGVVGCGEIAQIMHLPFLQELPQFEIAGLCDLSAATVDRLGDAYGVRLRTRDHRELFVDPAVEAVVVSTYDHADIAADAIAAGRHVLIEKPLAFTVAEGRVLSEAAAAAGVVALVGYMKLFDPGFELGVERIRGLGLPRACHVHDFAGRFDRYGAWYDIVRESDVSPDLVAAGRASVDGRIRAALGAGHAGYAALYGLLLMLGSHDLAVLRSALGPPRAVRHVQSRGDDQLLAVLELEGGVPCVFELAVGTRYEWWDEWMTVHGADAEVRIDFAHPYVRYATTDVRVREPLDGSPSTRVASASHDPAFRRQWRHFADCIRHGTTPRTPLIDGVRDLELAEAIIRALPRDGVAP